MGLNYNHSCNTKCLFYQASMFKKEQACERTDNFKGEDSLKLQGFKSFFSFDKNDCQNELLYHNNGLLCPLRFAEHLLFSWVTAGSANL